MKMIHEGEYKIVRLLPQGTKLFAVNDQNENVVGEIEAYRFAEYRRSDDDTSHDVEYRVKWSDGVYEWISWSECNTYSPQKPKRPAVVAHRPREHAGV